MKSVKYPQFASTLRRLGQNHREIAERINRSTRQVCYYLSGNVMPTADITARYPELHEALRTDLGFTGNYTENP